MREMSFVYIPSKSTKKAMGAKPYAKPSVFARKVGTRSTYGRQRAF